MMEKCAWVRPTSLPGQSSSNGRIQNLRHSKFVGLREDNVTGFNQYGASSYTAYRAMVLSLEVDHGSAPSAYARGVLKFTSFIH
jgi:hypothetical protein